MNIRSRSRFPSIRRLLADGDRAAAGKEDRGVYPRLLAVDNEVVVPVNTTVRVLVTASDVMHAFAMPAFGVKTDAVPGRINEIWFKARKEGLYYGQCSELCGKDHAYMPIAIRVVSRRAVQHLVRCGQDRPQRRQQGADGGNRSQAERGGRRQLMPRTREGIRNGAEHGRRGSSRRSCHHDHKPTGWVALGLFDQPQGHRHALPDLRDLRGHHRWLPCRSSCAWSCRSRASRSSPVWRRWSTASNGDAALDGGKQHVQCLHHRARA